MRNFALSLSIFLIFGLSGCGIKNDVQNNIYENQARYYGDVKDIIIYSANDKNDATSQLNIIANIVEILKIFIDTSILVGNTWR